MKNRPKLDAGHPERDDRRRVAVHDRLDLGMGLVDLAVNKSLKIDGPARRVDCIAVAVEFHDVGGGNQARRHAARQEEMLGVFVVTHADMAETVDDALIIKDAIGGDEVLDQRRIRCRRLRRGGCRSHDQPNSTPKTLHIDACSPSRRLHPDPPRNSTGAWTLTNLRSSLKALRWLQLGSP